jgi:hypothetical protein
VTSPYNLALMSPEDWEDSVVYREAYRLHGIRHVVEVPLTIDGETAGNLHFGSTERDFGEQDIRLADAIGEIIADTVEGIDDRDGLCRTLDQTRTALDLTGVPIVISDPRATELRLNEPARRLLADVIDAEEHVHRLLGRPTLNGGFTRRIEVELVSGETAVVHGHSASAKVRPLMPIALPPRGCSRAGSYCTRAGRTRWYASCR